MRDKVQVKIDREADAAYICLSDKPIARTVEVTDDVLIDLDEFNVAVGVEVLELGARIPFSRLQSEFHIHSRVVDVLRLIQPSVSGFFSLTQGGDSSTKLSHHSQAVPA